MARDLAAVKVRIGRDPQGRALYPAFGTLMSVQATGLDWSVYIDVHGLGWAYDQVSGHDDDDVDSPAGQQWGVILAPEAFVDEAVAAFPAVCVRITELEWTDFWENRVTVDLPVEQTDQNELNAITQQIQTLRAIIADLPQQDSRRQKAENRIDTLRTRAAAALDPNDPTPGVRKNIRKRWVDWKAKRGVNFVEPS